jgi:cell division protein FtsW (lipid II flippase)
MKYIAIWFGFFAGATVVAGGIVLVIYAIINLNAWWIVACFVIAALLATLAVSLEYLTDHKGETDE